MAKAIKNPENTRICSHIGFKNISNVRELSMDGNAYSDNNRVKIKLYDRLVIQK